MAPRSKGTPRVDPWVASVRRLLGARRDRVRTRELLTELGVAQEAQHHAARRLGPILRALGWRYMRAAEGYHWRRPVTVPPRRVGLFAASEDGRAERDRLLAEGLRQSARLWSLAELSAIIGELRAESASLFALAVEGDPCADLYRAEARALEVAAGAVDLLDIVPASGGMLDIDRALASVAANREAAALAVEACAREAGARGITPRLGHAKRRALELAAMRIRERGRVESIEQDRRRYPDREARRPCALADAMATGQVRP